jgi:hypothetical protein
MPIEKEKGEVHYKTRKVLGNKAGGYTNGCVIAKIQAWEKEIVTIGNHCTPQQWKISDEALRGERIHRS